MKLSVLLDFALGGVMIGGAILIVVAIAINSMDVSMDILTVLTVMFSLVFGIVLVANGYRVASKTS